MKSRDLAIGTGFALSLVACDAESTPQPDQMFAQELPAAVMAHQGDVAKAVIGGYDNTAITFRLGDKDVTASSKHTYVEHVCQDGSLISKDGKETYSPRYVYTAKVDLAILAITNATDIARPELAKELPRQNDLGYFMTYQGDNGIARGPEMSAPYDVPATYQGKVVKVDRDKIIYAMPTKEGSFQDFAGASGAAAFSSDGSVQAVVSMASKFPRSAQTINQELGSDLPEGHYNTITATPVSADVLDMASYIGKATNCS